MKIFLKNYIQFSIYKVYKIYDLIIRKNIMLHQ